MIKRKPIERLGTNGHKEVKSHPWLKNFPWKQLDDKSLMAPFIPMVNYLFKLSLEKILILK